MYPSPKPPSLQSQGRGLNLLYMNKFPLLAKQRELVPRSFGEAGGIKGVSTCIREGVRLHLLNYKYLMPVKIPPVFNSLFPDKLPVNIAVEPVNKIVFLKHGT